MLRHRHQAPPHGLWRVLGDELPRATNNARPCLTNSPALNPFPVRCVNPPPKSRRRGRAPNGRQFDTRYHRRMAPHRSLVSRRMSNQSKTGCLLCMHSMHNMHRMNSWETFNPAVIVRRARTQSGLSQSAFARYMGRSQAVVSRYETGKVEPPWTVIMQCMHLLEKEAERSPATNDQSWSTVMIALDSLISAIRHMQKAANNPSS